ncbi:hypothetical protein QTP88_005135 [Uroleucon formosanum]
MPSIYRNQTTSVIPSAAGEPLIVFPSVCRSLSCDGRRGGYCVLAVFTLVSRSGKQEGRNLEAVILIRLILWTGEIDKRYISPGTECWAGRSSPPLASCVYMF